MLGKGQRLPYLSPHGKITASSAGRTAAQGEQKLNPHWPRDGGPGGKGKGRQADDAGKKTGRGSEGVDRAWQEAGQIYGDLYPTVHTKAITGSLGKKVRL